MKFITNISSFENIYILQNFSSNISLKIDFVL